MAIPIRYNPINQIKQSEILGYRKLHTTPIRQLKAPCNHYPICLA